MQQDPTVLDRPADHSLTECIGSLSTREVAACPLATYRLQFHKDFRFTDALRLLPYLERLGVSHIYASPILRARAGSTHGYDITDHNSINPEIGSEQEFQDLVTALRGRGMSLVLDTVPNHMGVGQGTNRWWMDVLENGRTAEHADFFDIDWDPLKPELRDRVLLPILGEQYGAELESGRIRLDFHGGLFRVTYYETRLPVDPQTIPLIFLPKNRSGNETAQAHELPPDLRELLNEFAALPHHRERNFERVFHRRQRAPVLLERLEEFSRTPEGHAAIQRAIHVLNCGSSDATRESSAVARANASGTHDASVGPSAGSDGLRSFDGLHALLEAQAYRLAWWRVSAEEINYRRFFDVNDLVGLCMENPRVFAATHQLLRKLLADGSVTGIRIDHLDGLLNPRQYLVRLQMLYAAGRCVGPTPRPPLAENGIETEVQRAFGQGGLLGQFPPLYCVVEKILEPGEELPPDWPVNGTSGYDFCNLLNGIFIQKRNEGAFTATYHRLLGRDVDTHTLIYESKKLIMNSALASEVNVLAHVLDEISSANRRARDYTRYSLRDAIRETIACFPVYRSYIDERGNISELDRAFVDTAIKHAKRRNAGTASTVFDFLRDVLLLKPNTAGIPDEESVYRLKLHFTLKFQQLTGPVMAKGLEDTVCYVYNRFISVNEVGSSPRLFGQWIDDFHRANIIRSRQWPDSMLATSTHDSKRSEDVRARLNVISEMPRAWQQHVLRWRRTNKSKKIPLRDGRIAPDANEEYLLYQTLAGAWPFELMSAASSPEGLNVFRDRIIAYMTKAMHEAKVNLSWINDDPEYIDAVREFITRILKPSDRRAGYFVGQMLEFLPPVQFFGALNSLAQTLLRITSPGLPDTYQGTELWDFSLVDPDNRRAVDYDARCRLLDELESRASAGEMKSICAEMLAAFQEGDRDGRLKLWTLLRALNIRRARQEIFRGGAYLPLMGTGPLNEHLCAFARRPKQEAHPDRSSAAIIVVPRFAFSLMKGRMQWPLGSAWEDEELSLAPADPFAHEGASRALPTQYENAFTGELITATPRNTLVCSEIFRSFPIALLISNQRT